MDEIDSLQADMMRTLAHPRRLQILHRIARASTGVAALAADCGMTQPNVSQHLAVLRSTGMVTAERDGRQVRYRLADPDVMIACDLLRTVLERRLTRLGDVAAHRVAGSESIASSEPPTKSPSPQSTHPATRKSA